MKNWKVFLSALICMSVLFIGCNDDNDNPDNDNDEPDNLKVVAGNVRYEASVTDKENYKIRVTYCNDTNVAYGIDDIDKNMLIEEVVESPWSYEMEDLKTGAFLWISTSPVPRDVLVAPETTVTSRILIDGKLHGETTGDLYALVQHVLGTP